MSESNKPTQKIRTITSSTYEAYWKAFREKQRRDARNGLAMFLICSVVITVAGLLLLRVTR